MAPYLGDFAVNRVVRYLFDTEDATGAPVTMTVPVVRVYKDNSITESATGVTVTANFDGRTGMHLVEIDTSADAVFYAVASDFMIVLVSATVNGITILSCLAQFSMSNRSAPSVNVSSINNVSTASVTTVNANQGTTQPLNFTGAAGAALVKGDVVDWNSVAVATPNVNGVPIVDLKYTLGTISPATAGSVRADAVTTGVTVTTNNDKTGYALTAGERNSVADALLDRDMSVGVDSGSAVVRTMRQALRFLRNKWSISAGTVTVTKEDDTTASWTGAVVTTAGNPVSSIDPA